jgi:hypothetical protein
MLAIAGGHGMAATPQDLVLGSPSDQVSIELSKQVYLSHSQAVFTKQADTWTWVSDVEHVIEEKEKKEIFLADADPAYYLGGDTIPSDKEFELFPYHYYDEWEVEQLGKEINYSLIAENRGKEYVNIDITGMGTTTDWEHAKAWEGALAGKNKRNITLKPGERVVLWNEKGLKGGLPWSGIILGKASGDLFVADYCYTSEEDPGIAKAEPMPDLAWPPYLLASYSRGSTDWNAATIDFFPKLRDENNRLPFSSFKDAVYSFSFAASPGGPITNLCQYQAVAPTFNEDYFLVKDPVSGYGHPFFGGNYPIMYQFLLPLVNDTQEAMAFRFYLASNDRFGVDTLAGVWIQNQLLNGRVSLIKKNAHWNVFTLTLKPGEVSDVPFTVIPLGSRWGGMIGSFQVESVVANEAEK